ncbi:hypothetical protein [Metallibacterium scheffleri]|uniref:Uncharacterized protein n=1 Tax=Metallibacterium scheffleri TaxID=993689 RepID=A0A4S3KRV8_9GAMM|nr:hypothetical protein [Metallibacterium scheffleri]THD11845.1 hypothetical protein B1806_01845 [Metallibacterium scheffleri]
MARVRSPNYPSLSLPSAIDAARKIYDKEHTHKADPEVMAKALGYSGMNGASATALSALKKYGLLLDEGKQLKISADALTILVDPKDSVERAKLIVKAAFSPQLFSDLNEQYGETVPSDENMRAYLLKRAFSPSTVDAPIRTYRETMELVSEVKKLYDQAAQEVQDNLLASEQQRESTRNPSGGAPSKQYQSNVNPSMRQDVFSIEEGAVTIEWPAALSVESLKDVEDWLTIVKRKISRSVQKPEANGKPEAEE